MIKMRQILITVLVVTILATGMCYVIFETPWQADTDNGSLTAQPATGGAVRTEEIPETTEAAPNFLPKDMASILVNTDSVPLDTIPGSLTVLVNRDYLLPSSYTPAHLVAPNIRFSFDSMEEKRLMRKDAAKALKKMFRAAEKEKGILLYGVSGYRSYERQRQIYLRNVSLRGRKATDTVSALPGSSEHQTGLTMDISTTRINCALTQEFGRIKEGRWVAKNAHKYGYIVRYPQGKANITGYHYEPWHIRYVGIRTATYLYENNLTLEEYYGVRVTGTPKKREDSP